MRHDGRANPHQLLITDATWEHVARLREALRRGARRALRQRRGRRPRGRPAAHALGPLLAPERLGPPGAAVRLPPPAARRAFPARRPGADATRSSTGWWTTSCARRCWRSAPASTSWTSSTATATSATSCWRRATRERPLRRQPREPHALRCARSSRASGPRRRGCASACACRPSTCRPFRKGATGRGVPEREPRRLRLRLRPASTGDMDEALGRCTRAARAAARDSASRWMCITAGSPYYNPHVQRPALFPPSDGYLPPEDPLRRRGAPDRRDRARSRPRSPTWCFVGSAYSYLQEWLPNVGAGAWSRDGARGLRRTRPHGALVPRAAGRRAGRPAARPQAGICRTFSDCTTAPRNGAAVRLLPARSRSTPTVRRPRELKAVKAELRSVSA